MPVGSWYPGCCGAAFPCGSFSGVPNALPPSAIDTAPPPTGVSAAAATDFIPGRVRVALTTGVVGVVGFGVTALGDGVGDVGFVGVTGDSVVVGTTGGGTGFGVTTGWLAAVDNGADGAVTGIVGSGGRGGVVLSATWTGGFVGVLSSVLLTVGCTGGNGGNGGLTTVTVLVAGGTGLG